MASALLKNMISMNCKHHYGQSKPTYYIKHWFAQKCQGPIASAPLKALVNGVSHRSRRHSPP